MLAAFSLLHSLDLHGACHVTHLHHVSNMLTCCTHDAATGLLADAAQALAPALTHMTQLRSLDLSGTLTSGWWMHECRLN